LPRSARGLRNRGLIEAIVKVLTAFPWLALGEIVERVTALDRRVKSPKGSVATTLTGGIKDGRLIHDGAKIRRRYAVSGTPLPSG